MMGRFLFLVFICGCCLPNSNVFSATDEEKGSKQRPLIYNQKQEDFSEWFERNTLIYENENRIKQSKALNLTFAAAGSVIFPLLWCDFSTTVLHSPFSVGIALGCFSAITPILSYYCVNFDRLVFTGNSVNCNWLTYKNTNQIIIGSIANFFDGISSIPITYAAHKSFNALAGLGFAIPLDIPTFYETYGVYQTTSKKFLTGLQALYYKKRLKNEKISRIDQCVSSYQRKMALYIHVGNMIERYTKKNIETFLSANDSIREEYIITDTKVAEIYDNLLKNGNRAETTNNYNNIISFLNLSSVDNFISSSSICSKVQEAFQTPKIIAGMTGATIGIVGTYYFYDLGKDAMIELGRDINDMAKVDLVNTNLFGEIIGALILTSRSSFKSITTKDTFERFYDFMVTTDRLKKICDFGIGKLFCIVTLAALSSIPTMQLSLSSVGSDLSDWFIAICTGVSAFAGNIWLFNQVENTKRDALKRILTRFQLEIPYLKDDVIDTLFSNEDANTNNTLMDASVDNPMHLYCDNNK